MSEEYDNSNVYYSPFWPFVILLAGFSIWLGYQIYALNAQRAALNAQFEQVAPTVSQAQTAQVRLVSLLKDLAETSTKDQYANAILKEAIDAGIIRVTPNAPAGANSATPAASSSTPAK